MIFCIFVLFSKSTFFFSFQIKQRKKRGSPCRAGVESTAEIVLNYKKMLKKVFFSCYFWDSAGLCKSPIALEAGIKNLIYGWNRL